MKSNNRASKLSAHWEPDTILSNGDSTMNKTDKTSTCMEFTFKNDKRMGKEERAGKRGIIGDRTENASLCISMSE